MIVIFWQALCFFFLQLLTFTSLLFFFAPLQFFLSDHPSLPFSNFVFFFYFDSILRFISSHEKLLAGLKGSTRKDPSARLVFSGECIQCFALFCSTHYYIYPTLDSLYCRSQGLFSNLLHSSMKLWFYASLVTNHYIYIHFYYKTDLYVLVMFITLCAITCLSVHSDWKVACVYILSSRR